jgi:hypothetical protein
VLLDGRVEGVHVDVQDGAAHGSFRVLRRADRLSAPRRW